MSHIHIAALTDNREKDAMLTDMLGRPMAGTDLMDWLSTSLSGRGLTMAGTETQSDLSDKCVIELELRRAYITAQAASKSSSLVFNIRKAEPDAPAKLIRGNHSNMNWSSTNSETNVSLGRSLDEVVDGIADFCAPDE